MTESPLNHEFEFTTQLPVVDERRAGGKDGKRALNQGEEKLDYWSVFGRTRYDVQYIRSMQESTKDDDLYVTCYTANKMMLQISTVQDF